MPSGLYLPRYLIAERRGKPVNVVFYFCKRTNHILVGADEKTPMHPALIQRGYEKVVCRDAHTVDLWSQKLRDQEMRDQDIERQKQEEMEGPTRTYLRHWIQERISSAPDQFSRDAARYYLEKMDRQETERAKHRRISYQHCEAAEDGK